MQLMGEHSDLGLPRVLKDCLNFLLQPSVLLTQGLFRLSPSSKLLRQVREAYDRGHPITLAHYDFHAAPLASALIKSWLRSLPDPMFPYTCYSVVERCPATDSTGLEAVDYVRERLLTTLEPVAAKVAVLSAVMRLLHDIALRHGKLATSTCPKTKRLIGRRHQHDGLLQLGRLCHSGPVAIGKPGTRWSHVLRAWRTVDGPYSCHGTTT